MNYVFLFQEPAKWRWRHRDVTMSAMAPENTINSSACSNVNTVPVIIQHHFKQRLGAARLQVVAHTNIYRINNYNNNNGDL